MRWRSAKSQADANPCELERSVACGALKDVESHGQAAAQVGTAAPRKRWGSNDDVESNGDQRPYWPAAVDRALEAAGLDQLPADNSCVFNEFIAKQTEPEREVAMNVSLATLLADLPEEDSLANLGVGSSSRARVQATPDVRNSFTMATMQVTGREREHPHSGGHRREAGVGSSSGQDEKVAARIQEQRKLVDGSLVSESAGAALGSAPCPRNVRRARRRAEARGELGSPAQLSGCVVLVREDCRLHDNPALHAAAESHDWVLPLFVHDDDDPSPWPVRGAGLWWRHESLGYYDKSLRSLGSRIIFRRGVYIEQVVDVLMESGARSLHFNRQLEPWHIMRDEELKRVVGKHLGLAVHDFKGMVVAFEPWDVRDKSKKKTRLEEPLPPVTGKLSAPPGGWPWSLELDALGYGRTGGSGIPPGFRAFNEKRQRRLEFGEADPKEEDWAFVMRRFWRVGEHAAMERLEEWLQDAAWGCYFPPGLHPQDVAGGRFRADKRWTAIISPYLRFGDLSPRYVYARCRQALPFELRRLFTKRVIWRDKAYSQLYRWPESHSVSIRTQYEHEQWSGTRSQLRRWQRGETGFPLVDAAMRQLWKVGWICNHLRHVTAQFLIEHLDLSWKDGYAWYDYTLVDTDVAINAMMWQMGGHSGIGAWNFVMHPVFAGKKVDPEGNYVRKWLPELAGLPVEYIHCPWEAPVGTRIAAQVLINGRYWQRVLEDLEAARRKHQANVIAVRQAFPEFVDKDGNEKLTLGQGKVIRLEVRDDIRENNASALSLMMTADDPRSAKRRSLGFTKGVHGAIIYDETKRFEAMYDSIGDF